MRRYAVSAELVVTRRPLPRCAGLSRTTSSIDFATGSPRNSSRIFPIAPIRLLHGGRPAWNARTCDEPQIVAFHLATACPATSIRAFTASRLDQGRSSRLLALMSFDGLLNFPLDCVEVEARRRLHWRIFDCCLGQSGDLLLNK